MGDIYVLQVFTNDILDVLRLDYQSLQVMPLKPGFELEAGTLSIGAYPDKAQWEKTKPKTQTSKFKTYDVVRIAVEGVFQTRPDWVKWAVDLGVPVKVPRMPGLINGWYNDDVLARGVPLLKALMGELQQEVDARQGALLVMAIPSPLMVYHETYGPLLQRTFPANEQVMDFLADVDRPQAIIADICKGLDLTLLDLLPMFRAADERSLYVPREGHLTNAGHRVVAEALLERIQKLRVTSQ